MYLELVGVVIVPNIGFYTRLFARSYSSIEHYMYSLVWGCFLRVKILYEGGVGVEV